MNTCVFKDLTDDRYSFKLKCKLFNNMLFIGC